jgi:hypothetical protein
MQKIIECVSEALTLDSQGASDVAAKKYIECLEYILESLDGAGGDDDHNHDCINKQLTVIAANCLERLKEMNVVFEAAKAASTTLQQTPRKSSNSIDVSLSALRRLHERELAAGSSVPPGSPSRRPSTLLNHKPKQQPNGPSFHARLKAILSSRQERRERLLANRVIDWIRGAFEAVDLPSLSAVLSRPPFRFVSGEEQKLFEAVGNNNPDKLENAVFTFLSVCKEHPVVLLVDDFVSRLVHQQIGTRQDLVDEMHLFSRHFVEWFGQQWSIQSTGGSNTRMIMAVELGLQEYLLNTSLYTHSMAMYHHDFPMLSVKADVAFGRILSVLGCKTRNPDLLSHYDKQSGEPVCQDPIIMAPILANLSLIPATRTPSSKLNNLLKVCSELCRLFPGDEVGGEELMRLVAVCLVRSPVSLHMPAEVAFVADLVPESLLRGEAGYVLATLQAAIDFVQHL